MGGVKDNYPDQATGRERVLHLLESIPFLMDSTRQAVLELPVAEALSILHRARDKRDTIKNLSSYLYKAATNFLGKGKLGGLPSLPPSRPGMPQDDFRSSDADPPEMDPEVPTS